MARRPEPCTMVIFGASGDLTKRKLFPALYSLAYRQLLPEKFGVLGVARTEGDRSGVPRADEGRSTGIRTRRLQRRRLGRAWPTGCTTCATTTSWPPLCATSGSAVERPATGSTTSPFLPLHSEGDRGVGRQAQARGRGGRASSSRSPSVTTWSQPEDLNALLHEHFDENQIFRIDHYLGKETVQNMLALRFANGIFEPIWNRQFIDHVQITVAESIGIEGRAEYYEQAGAIRDIFQNHLLQLLALTAMEPPIDFTADSVRNEKVKVLQSIHTPGPKSRRPWASTAAATSRAQEVPGYREEPGVAPSSMTETFIAAKLFVDNWRWADTPFYVRAGKRLRASRDDDRDPVPARAAPAVRRGDRGGGLRPNVLLIHVQPDEGVSLAIGAKVSGAGHEDPDRAHGLPLRRRRSGPSLPEAYERLHPRLRCSATRLCSRARTRWSSSGRSSTRSSRIGGETGRRSQTTRPGRGAPQARTSSSNETGARWRRH